MPGIHRRASAVFITDAGVVLVDTKNAGEGR